MTMKEWAQGTALAAGINVRNTQGQHAESQ